MRQNQTYGNAIVKTATGTARIIRDSLPNASYIGFTGTPISREDRSTIEVFGDYIDVYDMTQAVLDGATRPVYYESRVIKLKLDDKILAQIDAEYSVLAKNADEEVIQELLNLAKELTETLRKNKTIDWQKKESARAKMRMIVKKLLKKYKYPPEGQDDALKTVISQCELWTDVIADFDAYPMSDGYGVLKVAEPQPEYMS